MAAVLCGLAGGLGGCAGGPLIDEGASSLSLPGGGTFVVRSAVLNETRRINVVWPSVYGEKVEGPLPVLYMLDGGLGEDFVHVAGLVQVLVSNGGMRPFLLVGIENTERRRDTTGPTSSPEDLKIAPRVGGSAAFRRFIKDELMPAVAARYAITGEAALIGESLAGLFVIETLRLDPGLFSTYIAIDPSLWWNSGAIVAPEGWRAPASGTRAVFIASSNEPDIARLCTQLAGTLSRTAGVSVRCVPFPEESHATIYHPAALRAFREILGPPPPPPPPSRSSPSSSVRPVSSQDHSAAAGLGS